MERKNRDKRLLFLSGLGVLLILISLPRNDARAAEETETPSMEKVWESEIPAHEFAGVGKCSLCHKKEAQGQQYSIWKDSAHARAFETLATPEARDLGAKFGIDDPQSSGKCLRCHSTAYNFGEQKVSGQIPVEEGVSCESCHGPGKDYMKIKVMKDRAAAVKNGLVIPDEQTCLKCHNASAPMGKEFNFSESWLKIKHPIPPKNE